MPLLVRQDDMLLRIIKDLNDIRSALRRVVGNIPLYDISNENTPAQITADQNDYVPGNFDVLRLSTDAPRTITGLRGGVKGRFIRLFNIGTYAITLEPQSASSTDVNRFKFSIATGNVILPGSSMVLYYDITQHRWVEGNPLEQTGVSKEFTAAQITADQDNYDPSDYSVLRLTSDAANRIISGFQGGVQGRFLYLFNVGLYDIILSHQDTASLEANRIILPVGTNMAIPPNGELTLYYDIIQQRWIVTDTKYASRLYVQLRLPAATQTYTNADATYPEITWDQFGGDASYFDVGSPTIVTIPEDGYYNFHVHIVWDVNATGFREALMKDNTGYCPTFDTRIAVTGGKVQLDMARTIWRVAGSTMEVRCWQNSGGNLNILQTDVGSGGTLHTEFFVEKIQ